MNTIERLARLRMARDFAVQAENTLLNLPQRRGWERGALSKLNACIEDLRLAINDTERDSKP